MRRLALALASVLALVVAGSASAIVTQPVSAVPQIEPVILGEVTGVTAHTVTVRSGTGEEMAFEFDSRTVKPMHLTVGDEFRLLDSGLHFAQRVTTLEPGSADWNALHEQRSMPSSYNEERRENSMQTSGNEREDENRNNNELPATASELPWVLTVGVLLLAVAAVMWLFRRRTV